MPNEPWRHHYVPQFLLRQWTSTDGSLERYVSPINGKVTVDRVAPISVGFERDLYRSPGHPGENQVWLETEFFQQVDNLAAKSLAKMLLDPPGQLNEAELSAWSVFIRALFHRSPDALAAYQASGMEVWKEVVESVGDRYEKLKRKGDPSTLNEYITLHAGDDAYRTVLENLPQLLIGQKIGQFLNDMHRIVIDIPESAHSFLISDAIPVHTNGRLSPSHTELTRQPRAA